MVYELIITEKAKAAQKIAEILAENNLEVHNINRLKYYVIGKKYIVTGVSGHVTKRTYGSRFKVWSKIEINELIEAKPTLEYDPTYKQYFSHLMKSYNISQIGLYTDDDMEGELIAADVYRMLNTQIVPVRYRTSSLDKISIIESIKTPGSLSNEKVDCAELRHKIDLQWGSTLSVMFTLYAKSFHTVGRVQTPVLNLIVERDKLIKNFVPKVFATMEILTKELKFESEELEIDDAKELLSTVESLKECTHTETTRIITRLPPKPLNVTDLMDLGNSVRLTGVKTMQIAETLYLKGLISYPRTNSRFSEYETIYEIFKKLNLSDKIGNKTSYQIEVGDKDSAHPPILPTGIIAEDLIEKERELYNKIIEHYTKILEGKNVVEGHFYQFSIKDIKFKGYQEKTLIKGFRDLSEYKEISTTLLIVDSKLIEHSTKKPAMYSESKLIRKMEELKIGTKSTRHTFVDVLRRRGYIIKMKPTDRGILFLDVLAKYVKVITQPRLTADIEEELERIVENNGKKNEIDVKYTQILRDIVREEIIKNRAGLMYELSATREVSKIRIKQPYKGKRGKFDKNRGNKTYNTYTKYNTKYNSMSTNEKINSRENESEVKKHIEENNNSDKNNGSEDNNNNSDKNNGSEDNNNSSEKKPYRRFNNRTNPYNRRPFTGRSFNRPRQSPYNPSNQNSDNENKENDNNSQEKSYRGVNSFNRPRQSPYNPSNQNSDNENKENDNNSQEKSYRGVNSFNRPYNRNSYNRRPSTGRSFNRPRAPLTGSTYTRFTRNTPNIEEGATENNINLGKNSENRPYRPYNRTNPSFKRPYNRMNTPRRSYNPNPVNEYGEQNNRYNNNGEQNNRYNNTRNTPYQNRTSSFSQNRKEITDYSNTNPYNRRPSTGRSFNRPGLRGGTSRSRKPTYKGKSY
jgi:DNA topoisomerase-1